MTTQFTDEERCEAGQSHFNYMRELLSKHGDAAKLDLHADHMRSLLAFVSTDKR